jgi:hypothetical protein
LITTKAVLPVTFTMRAVVVIARKSRIPARHGIKIKSAASAAATAASVEWGALSIVTSSAPALFATSRASRLAGREVIEGVSPGRLSFPFGGACLRVEVENGNDDVAMFGGNGQVYGERRSFAERQFHSAPRISHNIRCCRNRTGALNVNSQSASSKGGFLFFFKSFDPSDFFFVSPPVYPASVSAAVRRRTTNIQSRQAYIESSAPENTRDCATSGIVIRRPRCGPWPAGCESARLRVGTPRATREIG